MWDRQTAQILCPPRYVFCLRCELATRGLQRSHAATQQQQKHFFARCSSRRQLQPASCVVSCLFPAAPLLHAWMARLVVPVCTGNFGTHYRYLSKMRQPASLQLGYCSHKAFVKDGSRNSLKVDILYIYGCHALLSRETPNQSCDTVLQSVETADHVSLRCCISTFFRPKNGLSNDNKSCYNSCTRRPLLLRTRWRHFFVDHTEKKV